ncbi:MAG: putative bifunctional diguanylate cyclase/phosphodiesterase [Acidothermaceae bacterium]
MTSGLSSGLTAHDTARGASSYVGRGVDTAWFVEAGRHASVGMALVALDGRYVEVNDLLCVMLGRPAEDVIGRTTVEITHPDDRHFSSWSYPEISSSSSDSNRLEKRFLRPDGTVVQAIRVTRVVRDGDGNPQFMFAQYIDVTERNARFAGLADLGQRALDGDGDQLLVEARRLVRETLGITDEEAAAALDSSRDVLAVLPVNDQSFVRSVSNVLDAAHARRRAEGESRRMAMHDTLTGLPNRALLSEKVDEALGQLLPGREYICVLMLDLDGFKRVNDSLGHARGDALLRDVAQRLMGAVRPADTIARLGGDEFAVLLAGLTGPDEAEMVAQRLLDALKAPFSTSGRAVHLSASMGVAPARSRSVTVANLLADADLAMYEAKTSGKGRYVVFAPTFRKAAAGRLALEEDLRTAVTEGAFALHFQPVVDLVTDRWAGTEALLRWPHPTRGMVPPLDFIPLAEDTGLVVPLGKWVLEKALEHRASWNTLVNDQADFGVAINVSVRQLTDPGFVDFVETAIGSSGLPASAITLEMTESVFMDDSHVNMRALEALREIGVRIALDDFGTGYSSLSYLRRFKIDVLKLDRSFVSGLLGSSQDRAITRAVIDLASHLDLELVAEGIETVEQLDLLRQLGCRLGQGYLLHRPMPVDSIVEKFPRH